MELLRKALIVDTNVGDITSCFQDIFADNEWRVFHSATPEEAMEIFRQHVDLEMIIVGWDLGPENSLQFLEFVREHDANIALFFMDDDPRNSFSAYDCHRYRALPFFIHKNELKADAPGVAKQLMENFHSHMARLCAPKLHTEFGPLRSVLVHMPSEEVERIDPDNLDYYLFESLPARHLMMEQHRGFVRNIKEMGKRPIVLDVMMLLYDIVRDATADTRRHIIENVLFSAELKRLSERFCSQNLSFCPSLEGKLTELAGMDPRHITRVLLNGINVLDLLANDGDASMASRRECQVIEPAANLYFMRDPGFVLGETLFLSRMFWKIRRREPYILRELIEHHPFLKYVKTNTLDMDEGLQEAVSIEGGDTMAIAPGHYAIAESERTSRALIRKVAEYLFNNKKAEKLYQPLIPPKRAYIHLDTVCSLVGPSAVIVHTEAFNAYSETLLWTPEVIRRRGEPISLGINFIDVLQYEFRKEVIQAAGGGSRARLEQFDDATNVFMVNPETPMCYDRNTHTNQILRDKGFNVGVFSGSDLVMGRGGARCMTLPLHRD